MATHFTGPLLNRDRLLKGNGGAREWFSKQPFGDTPDYIRYMNDFTKANDYNTTDWTLTEGGTGSQAVGTSNAYGGTLTLTTGATSGNSECIQLKEEFMKLIAGNVNQPQAQAIAGRRLWFEASFKASDVATTDVLIALATTSTSLTPSDYIGFRMATGAAALLCKAAASSTATSAASGQNLAANTLTTVGIYFDGSAAHYFINRSYVASISTNLPTATLAPMFMIKTNSANARTLTLDYAFAMQER